MNVELDLTGIRVFSFNGENQQVSHQETQLVKPGVTCEVYEFVGDRSKDLGVITIDPKEKTKWQRVEGGDHTFEGYLSGNGRLTVYEDEDKQPRVYIVGDGGRQYLMVEVKVGQVMQWQAHSELLVYEVCYPPYKPGRYTDLPDDWKPAKI